MVLQTELLALQTIRSAGENFDSTAQWMQQWAAWGLEPDMWPQPSKNPPSYTKEEIDALFKDDCIERE